MMMKFLMKRINVEDFVAEPMEKDSVSEVLVLFFVDKNVARSMEDLVYKSGTVDFVTDIAGDKRTGINEVLIFQFDLLVSVSSSLNSRNCTDNVVGLSLRRNIRGWNFDKSITLAFVLSVYYLDGIISFNELFKVLFKSESYVLESVGHRDLF